MRGLAARSLLILASLLIGATFAHAGRKGFPPAKHARIEACNLEEALREVLRRSDSENTKPYKLVDLEELKAADKQAIENESTQAYRTAQIGTVNDEKEMAQEIVTKKLVGAGASLDPDKTLRYPVDQAEAAKGSGHASVSAETIQSYGENEFDTIFGEQIVAQATAFAGGNGKKARQADPETTRRMSPDQLKRIQERDRKRPELENTKPYESYELTRIEEDRIETKARGSVTRAATEDDAYKLATISRKPSKPTKTIDEVAAQHYADYSVEGAPRRARTRSRAETQVLEGQDTQIAAEGSKFLSLKDIESEVPLWAREINADPPGVGVPLPAEGTRVYTIGERRSLETKGGIRSAKPLREPKSFDGGDLDSGTRYLPLHDNPGEQVHRQKTVIPADVPKIIIDDPELAAMARQGEEPLPPAPLPARAAQAPATLSKANVSDKAQAVPPPLPPQKPDPRRLEYLVNLAKVLKWRGIPIRHGDLKKVRARKIDGGWAIEGGSITLKDTPIGDIPTKFEPLEYYLTSADEAKLIVEAKLEGKLDPTPLGAGNFRSTHQFKKGSGPNLDQIAVKILHEISDPNEVLWQIQRELWIEDILIALEQDYLKRGVAPPFRVARTDRSPMARSLWRYGVLLTEKVPGSTPGKLGIPKVTTWTMGVHPEYDSILRVLEGVDGQVMEIVAKRYEQILGVAENRTGAFTAEGKQIQDQIPVGIDIGARWRNIHVAEDGPLKGQKVIIDK